MAVDDVTEDLPPAGADQESQVLEAVKRYMRLLDAGPAPALQQYLAQYAHIADELRPALEGLALVHRAASPKPAATIIPPDDDFTAKPIGDFQIIGELGRGGMGVVYEAIQLSLGRRVALKVLPFASGLDEVRLQRFRNEAHAAATLHHTNIVPVYAVGSDRGVHYYAMQKIDGSTLAELIERMRHANPLEGKPHSERSEHSAAQPSHAPDAAPKATPSDTLAAHTTVLSESAFSRRRYYQSVVRMIHQAALAIEHAHQYGIIHRDIKPGNLLLDSVGKIWVADFGLAQAQNEASQLTRSGDPLGTLRYMSPEQAAGRRHELDHRTDIYSLGVTLYELLTLQPAIDGEGYREMLNNLALTEPVAPRSLDPALPIELDTIVRKAIAKSPAERYATAQALAEDLQAWLDDKPIAARPPTWLERISKWRRRNSGVVALASGMLALATLGLLITTLLIWRQQQLTSEALARETEQRLTAQRSFQQARSAVDTFHNLSESELAYRPDLQDLRRSFLETSLSFYQDFLDDRAADPQLASELEATSARVQQMVDELQMLDNLAPLLQLSDRRVQADLGIEESVATTLEQEIHRFEEQRSALADQFVGGLSTTNQEMSQLLHQFDSSIRQHLDDAQINRLHQIARQRRLPFTFKTSEIVTALALSREQRDAINRIIEETGRMRPQEFIRREFEKREPERRDRRDDHERPRPGGRDAPGKEPPPGPDRHGPPLFAPDGPWRDPPPQRGPDIWRSFTTRNTVHKILEILTPEQLRKWHELIGEPFN